MVPNVQINVAPMFFFSDPRCSFPSGQIQVQTEFPFYEPGGLVKGKIYIRIDRPTLANFIEIEVSG